jgi:hypothetical protein
MSRSLMYVVWRGFRHVAARRPVLLELAGPFTLLSVIATWTLLLWIGWALVYWPRLPGEFLFQGGWSLLPRLAFSMPFIYRS